MTEQRQGESIGFDVPSQAWVEMQRDKARLDWYDWTLLMVLYKNANQTLDAISQILDAHADREETPPAVLTDGRIWRFEVVLDPHSGASCWRLKCVAENYLTDEDGRLP
jgi:hypothetical protein